MIQLSLKIPNDAHPVLNVFGGPDVHTLPMRIKYIAYRIVKTIGLGCYAGTFEGIPYFTSTAGELKNRAAIALPGIGIFIHPDDVRNINLLRHEYGHMLQAKLWGKFFFYRTIAWTSLNSALNANRSGSFIHQHTWTEWSANLLSYEYFRRPLDWNFKEYPTNPLMENGKESKLPIGLSLVNSLDKTSAS